MKGIVVIVLLFSTILSAQTSHILYLGAKAHLGTGKVIDNSAIAVKDGKFTMVANALVIKIDSSAYDSIIYIKGKHVYPGFIAPNSTLGLTEIDAVRATLDVMEVGVYKPHIRSLIAFNTDSEIIPTVRSNGVLMAQVTPRGGVVTGSSSVMMLNGDNWEDAALKSDEGIHVNWPHMYKRTGWWAEPGTVEKSEDYSEKVDDLKEFLIESKAYSTVKRHDEKDLRLEAMRGIWNGKKTLYVHADYVKELLEIVQLKRDLDIQKMAIVGGYDSWMIADLMKENNITIMLKRLHSLPKRAEDDVDLPFKLPSILHKAGVNFCLQNAGDMEAMGTRNLMFYAGTAVAYGLDYEQAVASITLNPAKVMGIDKRVGSIEEGKDATFIVSSGDAFDMRTNHIEHAFIQGRSVDLGNRQLDLYKKYMNKYDLEIPDKHADQ